MKEIEFTQLEKWNACSDGIDWFIEKNVTDFYQLYELAKKDDNLQYIIWYIVQLMSHNRRVAFAVFAAELVLGIYEKKYPDDNRPYKAVEAAKYYLENPSQKAASAASAAASAASAAAAAANAAYAAYAVVAYAAAANAAYAAYAAASAAAFTAYAAANDAAYAAYAAVAAAAYTAYAAVAATAYADADRTHTQIKICDHGIKLLEIGEQNEN